MMIQRHLSQRNAYLNWMTKGLSRLARILTQFRAFIFSDQFICFISTIFMAYSCWSCCLITLKTSEQEPAPSLDFILKSFIDIMNHNYGLRGLVKIPDDKQIEKQESYKEIPSQESIEGKLMAGPPHLLIGSLQHNYITNRFTLTWNLTAQINQCTNAEGEQFIQIDFKDRFQNQNFTIQKTRARIAEIDGEGLVLATNAVENQAVLVKYYNLKGDIIFTAKIQAQLKVQLVALGSQFVAYNLDDNSLHIMSRRGYQIASTSVSRLIVGLAAYEDLLAVIVDQGFSIRGQHSLSVQLYKLTGGRLTLMDNLGVGLDRGNHLLRVVFSQQGVLLVQDNKGAINALIQKIWKKAGHHSGHLIACLDYTLYLGQFNPDLIVNPYRTVRVQKIPLLLTPALQLTVQDEGETIRLSDEINKLTLLDHQEFRNACWGHLKKWVQTEDWNLSRHQSLLSVQQINIKRKISAQRICYVVLGNSQQLGINKVVELLKLFVTDVDQLLKAMQSLDEAGMYFHKKQLQRYIQSIIRQQRREKKIDLKQLRQQVSLECKNEIPKQMAERRRDR